MRNPGPDDAHDVLAADEFAVPSADPELHRGPVELPADPVDAKRPHDVLAAEDFAIPVGPHHPAGLTPRPSRRSRWPWVGVAALALVAAVTLRRR